MACRKEAAVWLVGLCLGVCIAGCAATGVRRGQSADARPSVPVQPTVDRQRAPELRISTPPAQPESAAVALVQHTRTTAPAPAAQPPASAAPAPGTTITPAQATAPTTATNSDPAAALHALERRAAQEYANLHSYIVRFRRQEQVQGKDKPEEIILFKFRKQPFSIYFKWLGAEGKDREVVYVQGQHENKIHTRLAAGDMLLMPAGKRIALAPDNPLVLASSRHSINEAGVGSLLAHFGDVLQAMDRGDTRLGALKYAGSVKRPELDYACEAAEETIPPGRDLNLPRGGRRLWLFDPQRHLPTLIITQDEAGHQVEHYCFDRWQYPVNLDDDDFNPDKLWGRK